MAKDRKVIPFTGKYKKSLTRTTPNDLRAAATGTLALVLFLMVGFNFSLFEGRVGQDEISSGVKRGIASVPRAFEPQWKRSIANISDSVTFKASQKPTAMDKLNFGALEGQYSLKLENGRVKQIEFAKPDDRTPRWLSNRGQFIEEHAGVFAPGFKSAEKIAFQPEQGGFKETYRVMSVNGGSTVESVFEFHLDKDQRFMSLQVK